jgi:hypothetical protein
MEGQSPEKLMTNQFMINQKINNLLELDSLYMNNGKKNEKEIEENSSKIMDVISNEFNFQVENALIMNELLKTTDSYSNCSNQYPIIQKKLNNELYKQTNDMLINNRNVYYNSESIKRLKNWNKLWSFIYYFLILIFLILCFPRTIYEFIKYVFVIGLSFLYMLIVNKSYLFIYGNTFKIIISIIYFIMLLIIILFVLYKIATTFKYVLINLTDTMTKIYKFSEK